MSQSKYEPHQGKRERLRRLLQLRNRILKPFDFYHWRVNGEWIKWGVK